MIVCPRCKGIGQIPSDLITVGDRLRSCRADMGKTQEDVASNLRVSRAQLANLESDRSLPSIATLIEAAKLYSVSVDYLLGVSKP